MCLLINLSRHGWVSKRNTAFDAVCMTHDLLNIQSYVSDNKLNIFLLFSYFFYQIPRGIIFCLSSAFPAQFRLNWTAAHLFFCMNHWTVRSCVYIVRFSLFLFTAPLHFLNVDSTKITARELGVMRGGWGWGVLLRNQRLLNSLLQSRSVIHVRQQGFLGFNPAPASDILKSYWTSLQVYFSLVEKEVSISWRQSRTEKSSKVNWWQSEWYPSFP